MTNSTQSDSRRSSDDPLVQAEACFERIEDRLEFARDTADDEARAYAINAVLPDVRTAVFALCDIASYHEHGRHSALTPGYLANKAQRALDRLGGK